MIGIGYMSALLHHSKTCVSDFHGLEAGLKASSHSEWGEDWTIPLSLLICTDPKLLWQTERCSFWSWILKIMKTWPQPHLLWLVGLELSAICGEHTVQEVDVLLQQGQVHSCSCYASGSKGTCLELSPVSGEDTWLELQLRSLDLIWSLLYRWRLS